LALILILTVSLALAACADGTQGGSAGGGHESGEAAQPGTATDAPGATGDSQAQDGTDRDPATLPPQATPQPEAPGTGDPGEGSDLPEGAEPPLLSFEEAKAICAAWIDGHPGLTSYEVNWMNYESEVPPPTFSLFGEAYYEFSISYLWDQSYSTGYSHVALVHAVTGELLSLFMSQMEGEFLIQTIERMDDWYSGGSAAYPQAALLTADEAIEIYDAWVDGRTDDRDASGLYRLNSYFYSLYEIFGEQYYHFSAEEDFLYWYNILVHVDTGELLFMMISDGMFPETMIESLEDWTSKW